MKTVQDITVLVRARDEEKRIRRFCTAYKNATRILIADGGSVDRTKEIAAKFPNVEIRDFTGRTELGNGYWRNNDADHANFLISWSNEYDTQWKIYDDMDCVPNRFLRKDYRQILSGTDKNFVMAVRFYFWGKQNYFPKMSSPNGKVEPSLWAWRGELDFGFIDKPPAYDFRLGNIEVKDLHTDSTVEDLYPPYALLHYSWDKKRVEHKIKQYAESGFIPGYAGPEQFAGAMIPKEEWMKE